MKRTIYFMLMLTGLMLCLGFGTSAVNTAGRVTTEGGRLNLRSAPSASASVVGGIPDKSWITVKSKSGDWFLAEYAQGKEAYVNAGYVSHYTSSVDATVKLSSGVLNVRSGAGTEYEGKDRLYNGERVVVVKSNSTWCGIVYRGNKTGYVAKAYLKKTEEASPYKPVSLDVPSFKQTDSRWKNYPIGTTGGTIGTIGCTTTALAMTESYHNGAVITPPQMAKQLSYSASGSLYWPSTYSVGAAGNGYLKEIYSLLAKGKPVVLGLKTAGGSQHWVTVYGFKGGNSPDSSLFLVNDPGSSTRTTLAQVMNSYPNPYKLVYRR